MKISHQFSKSRNLNFLILSHLAAKILKKMAQLRVKKQEIWLQGAKSTGTYNRCGMRMIITIHHLFNHLKRPQALGSWATSLSKAAASPTTTNTSNKIPRVIQSQTFTYRITTKAITARSMDTWASSTTFLLRNWKTMHSQIQADSIPTGMGTGAKLVSCQNNYQVCIGRPMHSRHCKPSPYRPDALKLNPILATIWRIWSSNEIL